MQISTETTITTSHPLTRVDLEFERFTFPRHPHLAESLQLLDEDFRMLGVDGNHCLRADRPGELEQLGSAGISAGVDLDRLTIVLSIEVKVL